MRAHVDEDAPTLEPLDAAVRSAHLDGPGRHESPLTKDQLRTAVRVVLAVHCDQLFDHLSLATANAAHVDSNRARGDTEFRAATAQSRNARAMNHVLAREARDVRTGSTDETTLDDGGTASRFGQRPRNVLTGLAAAENEDVMARAGRHGG